MLTQHILDADDRRYDAMIRNDLEALGLLLADELVYLHSSGNVHTRQAYLDYVATGRIRYLEAQRPEATVVDLGGVALMHGRVLLKVLSAGQPKALDVKFQSVWRRAIPGWQMAGWASVSAPPPAAP